MRLKFLGFVLACLLLFIISESKINHAKVEAITQEDQEMTVQKVKQRNSMKDIVSITTALADYVTDHGIAPKQDGTYDENSEFCKALSPFYIRNPPIYDGWGNPFRVYCGEACNGTYRGVEGCDPGHFMVVSFGRDGEKEDWEYDHKNSAAGLYELKILDDFEVATETWICNSNQGWCRQFATTYQVTGKL